jgi:hypothetical protein
MMKQRWLALCATIVGVCAAPAHAEFHQFRIDQIFSNADGRVQYVVLRESTGSNGEDRWAGHALAMSSAGAGTKAVSFMTNLPSPATASRSVLVATSGFAALGLVAPDYTMPDGFLAIGGGTLDYAGADQVTYASLPTDGATAIDHARNRVAATPKNFAGASATLMASAGGAPDLDQHGFTGSWYEPATSGQGVELEFYVDQVAPGTALVQGAWFTFDTSPPGSSDRQRWYTFSGNAQSGQASVPITIFQDAGGNFNAPPIIVAAPVGSGTLSFSDCSHGALAYALADGRTHTIPLTRLLPNVTCSTGSTRPTNADFALSGNWYDPATSGQGFALEVNPAMPFFFLTWYTYAPAGQAASATRQRWFTGQASYTSGSRSITARLFETTGGVFDQPTNPSQTTVDVGTATLTLRSCSSVELVFNFTAGSNAGRMGTIVLSRVGPVPPGCQLALDQQSDMPMPGGGYGGGYGP